MLVPPNLSEEEIRACLQQAYAIQATTITFLPLGNDPNTAVYRADTNTDQTYFVKLRSGIFEPTSVILPKWLFDQGLQALIPPQTTRTGQLWAPLGRFTLIIYPFVVGEDAYVVTLTEQHWRTFGSALKFLHTATLPTSLAQQIPQEAYSPHARETIRHFMANLNTMELVDQIAVDLAGFLHEKQYDLSHLVNRAEQLAAQLQATPRELVVCHTDAHAANLLIDAAGQLFIVDWDNPLFAPKERDLMFVGGAQGFVGHTPASEERLFYQGYGPTHIDPIALAYYRYERIVQDIYLYCEQIFLSPEGGDDRPQALIYLKSNWPPGNTLARAYAADPTIANGS